MALETEPVAPAAADAPLPVETEVVVADAPIEEAPATIETDLAAIWDKHNPERLANGQFKAKEESQESPDQAPVEKPEETAAPSIPVPQSWSAELKEKWEAVPPEAREFIVRREKESHDKITQQGQQIAQLEPVRTVIDRFKDSFTRNGVTPDQGVAMVLAASDALERNPHEAIAHLMRQYGVDPRVYVQQGEPGKDAPPETAALKSELASLRQELNQTRGMVMTREQHELAAQQNSIASHIEQFSKDKPDWGELEDTIYGEILAIKSNIEAGLIPAMEPKDILAKAYDRSLRVNEAAWNRKQEADRKAEDQKRIDAAKKRSEDAKKAAPLAVKSSTANASKPQRTMDDTLKEIARQQYNT